MVLSSAIIGGFSALAAADYLAILKKPLASGLLGVLGYLAVAVSLAFMIFGAPFPALTGASQYAGIVLALVAGIMLIWSVFLELPHERRKFGLKPEQAVTSGTYSLCRHPGWWWLALFIAGIYLIKRETALLTPSIILNVANLALIALQDHFFFPQLFEGYDDYKKSTPFLLPSVRRRG